MASEVLRKCTNPGCQRRVPFGVAFCCEWCNPAYAEFADERPESGHSEFCEARAAERGESDA